MALAQAFYNLKNVHCVLSTGDAGLINISIKRKIKYAMKQVGSALVPSQVYVGEDLPDISAEVYNDNNNNFATIVPNTAIASFALTSNQDTNANFLPTDFLTKFPPSSWVFGDPETDLDGEKVSTTKFKINCNVLNPGVSGGYSYTGT